MILVYHPTLLYSSYVNFRGASHIDIRDLTQLGRERRRRRLLKFELPIFSFLVCRTRSFLFNFA